MKGKTSRMVVLLVAVALLMAFGPVVGSAKGNKTEFTGIETWWAAVDPGVWVTLPSGNIRARGVITQYFEESSDPRMAGINTVVMNANLVPPEYSGPVWGTFHNEVADGVRQEWCLRWMVSLREAQGRHGRDPIASWDSALPRADFSV